jgi:hypothetical protein
MSRPALSSSQNAPTASRRAGLVTRDSEVVPEAGGSGPVPASERGGDITARVRSVVSHEEDLTPVIGRPKNRMAP